MSSIVDGLVVSTSTTKNAKGGTELMRSRLLNVVDKDLLKDVAIHFSRVEKLYANKINILYAHDLPNDPMYQEVFKPEYLKYINIFVFVSYHQRDLFVNMFDIPYSKCYVVKNAIGDYFNPHQKKNHDATTRFIYHTTPHRGLNILYPIFDALSKSYDIHLDVYSSFEIYGWSERDKDYAELFDKLKAHEKITYHGTKSNEEIVAALQSSHIFLYPCTWHETSCLALMEAIQNGCICVHPDYGALPETAQNYTYMFPMSEQPQQLATRAYNLTKYILDNQSIFREDIERKTSSFIPYSLKQYSIQWNQILKELHDGRNNSIS